MSREWKKLRVAPQVLGQSQFDPLCRPRSNLQQTRSLDHQAQALPFDLIVSIALDSYAGITHVN